MPGRPNRRVEVKTAAARPMIASRIAGAAPLPAVCPVTAVSVGGGVALRPAPPPAGGVPVRPSSPPVGDGDPSAGSSEPPGAVDALGASLGGADGASLGGADAASHARVKCLTIDEASTGVSSSTITLYSPASAVKGPTSSTPFASDKPLPWRIVVPEFQEVSVEAFTSQ